MTAFRLNEIEWGQREDGDQIQIYFMAQGKKVFRKKKFFVEEDKDPDSKLALYFRKLFYNLTDNTCDDAQKKAFIQIWKDYQKTVRVAIGNKRSTVSNLMKAIFMGKPNGNSGLLFSFIRSNTCFIRSL